MVTTRNLIKKTRLKPGREFFESAALRGNHSPQKDGVSSSEGLMEDVPAAESIPASESACVDSSSVDEPKI